MGNFFSDILGGAGDLLGGLFGGGGGQEQTSQSSQSGAQTQQQLSQQAQEQWQQQLQQQQQMQLAQALQQLSGFGTTAQQQLQNLLGGGTTAQQTQYGLAPQDPLAAIGQQGMLGSLLGGYQNTPLLQSLGVAAGGIGGNIPEYMRMLFNPAASQGAQSSIQGMQQAAQSLYQNLMKPEIDANYTKTGMFGSSPWAAEQARGAGNLAANLGGQAAGIYGQQQNLGAQGLQSFLPQLTQAAGLAEQYNPWSQMMPYWAALTQTGAKPVVTGQYGTQQYGQTGGTAGTGTQQYGQTGTSSQLGFGSTLAQMLGLGGAQSTQQGFGTGQQTGNYAGSQLGQTNPSMGSLFQGGLNMLGGSNLGNLFGTGGLLGLLK